MQLPRKYKAVLQPRGGPGSHHEFNNAEERLLALARKNFKVRAKHAALRHTDPPLARPHSGGTAVPKAGLVPDFGALHAQWDARLSSAKQAAKARNEATSVKVCALVALDL